MTLKATGTIWKKEPMYRYCTKKMVDKAVKQGREAVIKCASDKWWFWGTCTLEQLKYYSRYPVGKNCSLCDLNGHVYGGSGPDCGACPLNGHCRFTKRADLLFWQAALIVEDFRDNPTATNFKKFQAKARKLARVIGRLK